MKRLVGVNPSLAVLAILLAGTATMRLVNVTGAPGRVDDEGTYVAQAYAVTQWGELAHYTYWYDHPPLGWLQLALWSLVVGPDTGGNAVAAARYLMVMVAVITAGLLWLLARRLGLSRWASGAAVAVFALSPLAIALGRTVYLDNIAVAWLLAAFVLLCSPQRRLSAIFGAAVCFGVAVLTKETLLLLVPTAIWLLWTRTAPATRRYALAVFGAVFTVVLATYPLLAAVRGELLPGAGHVSLLDGIRFQLWQRDPGGSVVDPYSLKRHTVVGWLHHDPVLPVLAAPVAIAGLLMTRLRPIAVGLAILVAMVARPGYLPVPFFVAALPLAALLIAGIAESVTRYLVSSAEKRWVLKRLVAGPALAGGC
jgi:4-amino-4-deoxy-L-arabinose transferase-like glycosyltransferase